MERLVPEKGKATTWASLAVICVWCDRMVNQGWVWPKTHVNGGYGGICEGACSEAVATKLMEAA